MTLAAPFFYFGYLLSVELYRIFKLTVIVKAEKIGYGPGCKPLAKAVKDRYVLITGGSSGIGLELCKLFARDGARILIAAFEKEEVLATVAKQLQKLGSPEVRTFRADLTAEDAIDKLYEDVKSFDINYMIHNAGFGAIGDTMSISQARTEGMIELHNRALVKLYYKFLPDLLKRQKTRKANGEPPIQLLNTASIAAFRAVPRFNAYAASKAYVRWFSEGIRAEIASSGMKLTLLCPGATSTAFVKTSGFDKTRQATLPSGTTTPEYVALYAYYAMFFLKANMAIPGLINWFLYHTSPFIPEWVWNAYMMYQMSH